MPSHSNNFLFQPFFKFLGLILGVIGVIFLFDHFYLNRQGFALRQDSDLVPSPTPISVGQPLFLSPTPDTSNVTVDGYQNEKLGFSLKFAQPWLAREINYVANATSLVITNPEAQVEIQFNYLPLGLEGQTGPTRELGELAHQGSFILAGKNLDRYKVLQPVKNSAGEQTVDAVAVVYAEPNTQNLEFLLSNLQLSIKVLATGKDSALSAEAQEEAEKVLSSLKVK